jgi:peptidoglycan/xylan/chitin deacetylase (PgdA/CDA1 family)
MRMAEMRETGRALAIRLLALRKLGARPRAGIRFVCYHDVLQGEIGELERQLVLIGGMGTFISLDQAIGLMARQAAITSPLFTLTFDDGLAGMGGNAWPVFERLKIPFSIFLITGSVGTKGYMTWDEVAGMAPSPLVTFGSHTVNHRNLAKLSGDEVRAELAESKQRIEAATKKACDHFCCPWGRPGRDFRPDRDPAIATELGYRSFLTTERGLTQTGDKLPLVKRDVIHMHSSDAELRHFLL